MQVTLKGSRVDYSSVYLKLVNDATGEVRKEQTTVRTTDTSETFALPPAGHYTLYVVRTFDEGDSDLDVHVRLVEGVGDPGTPLLVSFLALLGPALLLVAKIFRSIMSE
jgi:hypothetical protein